MSSNTLYRPMGLFERNDIMLAGPSNYGLADPAQLSAISLGQATVAFVAILKNIDLLIGLHICQKLQEKICNVLVGIQKNIESDGPEKPLGN